MLILFCLQKKCKYCIYGKNTHYKIARSICLAYRATLLLEFRLSVSRENGEKRKHFFFWQIGKHIYWQYGNNNSELFAVEIICVAPQHFDLISSQIKCLLNIDFCQFYSISLFCTYHHCNCVRSLNVHSIQVDIVKSKQ